SGDVKRSNERMLGGVSADALAAVDDRDDAFVDERRERVLEDWAERFVDRVHLEEDHFVLDEKLVKYIHRWDRRDVSAAEDEADSPGVAFFAVGRALGRRFARLDPDVGADALEHQALHQRRRINARDDPAVFAYAHDAWLGRAAGAERVCQEARIPDRGHDPGD